MDVPEAADNLRRFEKETGQHPFPLSASNGTGIEQLKKELYDWRRGRGPYHDTGSSLPA